MDHKDVLKQRLEFYNEVKSKVEVYVGSSNRAMANYKKTYLSEICLLRPQKSSVNDFFESLNQTEVLLFGDFHAEPQSVRSLLRVCRKHKNSKMTLGLECFDSKYQSLIDKYQAGRVSEDLFLLKTQWNKNWDFSFGFVKPLLMWARENDVHVYGINSEGSSFSQRDKKIAQNIKKIRIKNPEKILIVQIGDYHLAKKHLPHHIRQILPKVKLQTVFQSPDELYFRLLKKNKALPDFIRLGKNQWAVMAVLPWVKWQNYLLWLESSPAYKVDDEIDMTDHVARCVKFISDTLKIETDTSELSIYAISDIDFEQEFKKLDLPRRKKIKIDILDRKSFFIPELKKGYLESFSLNHISRLAADYFIFKQNMYTQIIADPEKQFVSLIWLEMVAYFCAKLVNPKRKSNTVFDMRTFLNTENFDDHGKEVLAIALMQKLKEMNSASSGFSFSQQGQMPKQSKYYAPAARLLGGMLGEKVFWAYINRQLKFPEAKSFLFQSIYSKSFRLLYYELLEVIDQWPSGAKSKFDQF
jgi:hypothetical protein